jgi:hypothetical protein
MFQLLGWHNNKDESCTCEIKFSLAMAKTAFNKMTFFHQQSGLKCKKETSELLYLEQSFVWC